MTYDEAKRIVRELAGADQGTRRITIAAEDAVRWWFVEAPDGAACHDAIRSLGFYVAGRIYAEERRRIDDERARRALAEYVTPLDRVPVGP